MSECLQRALVGRHFAGTISPAEEHAMRGHLASCESCGHLYARHRMLARLDPTALPAEERLARGLGLRARGGHPALRLGASIGGLVAAAAALLLWGRAHPGDGFTARGGPPAASPTSRVLVYDVQAEVRPLRSGDTFGRNDELALAYDNGLGKPRLMVFGVDEHRHVYWFYPAWTREADDPVAVSIATDAGRHELPDAVRHAFDGRTLELHALFTDAPLSVKQVEATMAARPGPVALPGAVDAITTLAVAP